MNLSKTKYCNGIQCKKMLWLDKYKKEEKEEINNESILENGKIVHEVARNLFEEHILIEYNEDLDVMISKTNELLKNKNIVIAEATLKYNDNYCSIDILKKSDNEYEIYEVKSSTKEKYIYIKDVSYQLYVLNNIGLNVKKCYLVYLNNEYVKEGDLDLNKLFVKKDITKEVYDLQEEVQENIYRINEYMKQTSVPEDDIDKKCFNPYPCPFFKYCTKSLPENNIFNIAGMYTSEKINYYKQGIYEYESLLKENIKDIYKQQIIHELENKEDYIDIKSIERFLNTLHYPLYFLDFETYQMPIPKYDGVKPYMQIPFQYSLHYIEKEDGTLLHKEFLAEPGIDPRRKLAENLVNDIPEDVCVIAYNMSFEKTVIKHLANMYPDLSSHLMNIHDNIKDLMIPFKNRFYYSKDMHGSYSIKYVLPALFPDDESLNYHNLDLIHNGSDAMSYFATLEEKTKEEQQYIRERLLKYCELDTYAMVKIYEKLIDIVK